MPRTTVRGKFNTSLTKFEEKTKILKTGHVLIITENKLVQFSKKVPSILIRSHTKLVRNRYIENWSKFV